MNKVFLDTNIVIDFLTHRLPFSIEAARIFQQSEKGKLKIYVSSLSINNIHYVIGKLESRKKATDLVKRLMPLIEVLPVERSTIEKSLLSKFKDFEDGVQNFCAKEGKVKTIVTRNIKDYSKSTLSIQTPNEYLVSIQ